MEKVRISTNYQIIIPKSIRQSLALKPGDKMIMSEKDGIIYLVKKQQISKFKGKFNKLTTNGLRDETDRIV